METLELAQFGRYGSQRIDHKNLSIMVKNHENSIRSLSRNLKIFNATVILVYIISLTPTWWLPHNGEIFFTVMMITSWILFIVAMCKIRKTLKELPNCFTNEWITMLHFVVLTIQAICCLLYAIFYVNVFLRLGHIRLDDQNLYSLQMQTTTNIILAV